MPPRVCARPEDVAAQIEQALHTGGAEVVSEDDEPLENLIGSPSVEAARLSAEEAEREAARLAAEEAEREAARLAAEEAEREAARLAAEEAEREAARLAAEEAEREAARLAADEETEETEEISLWLESEKASARQALEEVSMEALGRPAAGRGKDSSSLPSAAVSPPALLPKKGTKPAATDASCLFGGPNDGGVETPFGATPSPSRPPYKKTLSAAADASSLFGPSVGADAFFTAPPPTTSGHVDSIVTHAQVR